MECEMYMEVLQSPSCDGNDHTPDTADVVYISAAIAVPVTRIHLSPSAPIHRKGHIAHNVHQNTHSKDHNQQSTTALQPVHLKPSTMLDTIITSPKPREKPPALEAMLNTPEATPDLLSSSKNQNAPQEKEPPLSNRTR
jgi:hypothetical protein